MKEGLSVVLVIAAGRSEEHWDWSLGRLSKRSY